MPRPARHSAGVATTAAAAVLVLAGGLIAVTVERADRSSRPPTIAQVLGRVAPELGSAREDAVAQLLAQRAAALRGRDRAAWLAGVDPLAGEFRDRQGRLYDALVRVPVEDWAYRLDAASEQPADPALTRRHGPSWWSPRVTLAYRLAGFDAVPTTEPQQLTFVSRDGRWYLAADDDFGDATARGIWDGGPVVAVERRSTLVLGHPSSGRLLRSVADVVEASVPRVSSVWGSGWAQRVVVLVPSSQRELQDLLGGTRDVSRIAAFAVARAPGVGERIVVNPGAFARLSEVGRRVVLTHEVAHVATRRDTGGTTPAWLVEGLADYIGYVGIDLPYTRTAAELRAQVQRGDGPTRLPTAEDFAGSNPDLASIYEQAWLAATLLAETYGQDGLVRLYRAVGQGVTVDAALRSLFGSDEGAFVRSWQRNLRTRLS